jgi:ABC-2 type transport system ATP-binding protein
LDSRSPLAIEASGLAKSFGDTRAVCGVDLSVRAGTVYGFLGPNGAGKTTTIRMLATLLEPDEGTAYVLGHDVVRDADAVRRRVSLTGQYASVDEQLTGRENLVLLGRLLGYKRVEAKARADELLEAFDLTAKSGSRPNRLSGGMRRRLLIARALVHRPRLVILDEPTAGVDLELRHDLWRYLARLNRDEETTVLLTTHYLEEAEALCERIALIRGGRILAEGTQEELRERFDATGLEGVYLRAIHG